MANPAADALASKASQKELGGDLDGAFSLYVQATQSYLHLSRTATSPHLRDQHKASATRCLERAERIKAAKRDVTPVQRDRFSKESQHYALTKSGTSAGIRVPPWQDYPSLPDSGAPYVDPDGFLTLSEDQRGRFSGWKRGPELMENPVVFSAALRPEDLVQGNPTDCSVIASLVVCLHHHQRFGSRLGLSSLFPQDSQGIPTLSPTGMYKAKLLFNGIYREIAIDDRLPVNHDGSLACSGTRRVRCLWPSLLEKAYLKINGGYTFAGSNSCIDIHSLTGWIPELVSFQRSGFRRSELWQRILAGFDSGICVITLNTHLSAAPFGLIPNHSYAILGVSARQGLHAVGILESEYANEMQRGNPSTDRDFTLLELDWEDVCDQFSSICINWDPSIFTYRDVVHGTWESSGKVANHQFRIRSNASRASAAMSRNSNGTKWCLLTRHTRTIHDKEDLIALHSFISNGSEQVAQSQALKEAYSDSPQCMTILDHDTGCEAVTLVASHHASGDRECGYTLQIFSNDPVELYDAKPSLPYRKELFGSLSSRNSGGNALFPTFFMNPQYVVVIHPSRGSPGPGERSDARLFLHGDRNIPLNIKVIWSSGPRITDVSQGHIAIDSGAYNYGYVYATGSLRPGQYTAVVSSFEPRMTTEYSLVLESSTGFDISPIPSEGADMFAKTVKGIWESGRNVIYELITPQQTEIQIRLQFADPGIRIPLKLLVYPESRTPASQASPLFSAQSSGAISGVLTERSMCSAGKFLIVPSAQRASAGKRFLLFVYSSACPVSVTQKFIDG